MICDITGKVGYSVADAKKVLREMERRGRINKPARDAGKAEAYKCRFCGEHHIGHRGKR